MEITYIGYSSFKIKGKDLSLVIDPYSTKVGYKYPKQSVEVLLTTSDRVNHHNVAGVGGYKLHIDGAGEYELSDVFVHGIQVMEDSTTAYLIDIDGFSILHLGSVSKELSKSIISQVPNVDVLMIPVGGGDGLNASISAKVISSLEPKVVIPMHYKIEGDTSNLEPLSKFLDEMGVEGDVIPLDKLKLANKSSLPEETTVMCLVPKH